MSENVDTNANFTSQLNSNNAGLYNNSSTNLASTTTTTTATTSGGAASPSVRSSNWLSATGSGGGMSLWGERPLGGSGLVASISTHQLSTASSSDTPSSSPLAAKGTNSNSNTTFSNHTLAATNSAPPLSSPRSPRVAPLSASASLSSVPTPSFSPSSSPLSNSSLVNAPYTPTMTLFSNRNQNQPDREGWLTKQGKVVKSWKRRWFVLKDNTLSYYKSKEYFLKGELTGKIDLTDSTVVQEIDSKKDTQSSKYNKTPRARKGQGNTFELRTADRTFIMYADSTQEMEDWLADINRSVMGLSGTSPQPYEEVVTVLLHGELDCERCCDRILKLLLNFVSQPSSNQQTLPHLSASLANSGLAASQGTVSSSPTFSMPIPSSSSQVMSVHIDPKEELVVVVGKNLDPSTLIARLGEAGFAFTHVQNKSADDKHG